MLVPIANTSFTTILAPAQPMHIGSNNRRYTITTSEVRATVTAAAQAYATGTTQQGVMFGFDPAHTNWNRDERILSVSTLSLSKAPLELHHWGPDRTFQQQ